MWNPQRPPCVQYVNTDEEQVEAINRVWHYWRYMDYRRVAHLGIERLAEGRIILAQIQEAA